MRPSRWLAMLCIVTGPAMIGCQPSPGNLGGTWSKSTPDGNPGDGIRSDSTLTYQIQGDSIRRIAEQRIEDETTHDVVTLRIDDRGIFTVDTTVTPNRMDISGITSDAYPTAAVRAAAAVILGESQGLFDSLLQEQQFLTFDEKAIYERQGNSLRIKFGNAYPPALAPPYFDVDRQGLLKVVTSTLVGFF